MTLHSTLFILVHSYVSFWFGIIYSTFHSVYISTKNITIPAWLNTYSTFHSVYISTGFPAHPILELSTLHSTLFILVRYSNSRLASVTGSSTFHSVYISTFSGRNRHNLIIDSTFHSVYISTQMFLKFRLNNRISTFHSVYISTRQVSIRTMRR